MERIGDRSGKMERCCSTGQSPQRAIAPTEEEEEGSFFTWTFRRGTSCSCRAPVPPTPVYNGMLKLVHYLLLIYHYNLSTSYRNNQQDATV